MQEKNNTLAQLIAQTASLLPPGLSSSAVLMQIHGILLRALHRRPITLPEGDLSDEQLLECYITQPADGVARYPICTPKLPAAKTAQLEATPEKMAQIARVLESKEMWERDLQPCLYVARCRGLDVTFDDWSHRPYSPHSADVSHHIAYGFSLKIFRKGTKGIHLKDYSVLPKASAKIRILRKSFRIALNKMHYQCGKVGFQVMAGLAYYLNQGIWGIPLCRLAAQKRGLHRPSFWRGARELLAQQVRAGLKISHPMLPPGIPVDVLVPRILWWYKSQRQPVDTGVQVAAQHCLNYIRGKDIGAKGIAPLWPRW